MTLIAVVLRRSVDAPLLALLVAVLAQVGGVGEPVGSAFLHALRDQLKVATLGALGGAVAVAAEALVVALFADLCVR